MCLVIDLSKHTRKSNGLYRPKISLTPIHVYKVLWTNPGLTFYHTAIRDHLLGFINGKCVLKSDMMDFYKRNSTICSSSNEVDVGIHAFTHIEVAKLLCRRCNVTESTTLTNREYHIFHAIIPPFTKYFIGVRGEIVSEKLIIKNKII